MKMICASADADILKEYKIPKTTSFLHKFGQGTWHVFTAEGKNEAFYQPK